VEESSVGRPQPGLATGPSPRLTAGAPAVATAHDVAQAPAKPPNPVALPHPAASASLTSQDPSSFVGRREDVADVRRLLSASRLVTLTGAGGVGKSRLARQSAAGVRRAFPDGVWVVDVAEAHAAAPAPESRETPDPQRAARVVAAVLGVPDGTGRPPLDELAAHLRQRRLLLVLDNCEPALSACAVLAGALLRACPRQRILATSRQPLDVGGEVTLPVPPLATSGDEPVALFAARAAAARPGFALDGATAGVVADVCRCLDGLPLAIELAAEQLRTLEPRQLLARLTDPAAGRLPLASEAGPGAPPRHRSLRACVDWSYDLCTGPERTLWARLSVFAGGFGMDAVEAVCADDVLPEDDLLDLVATLVDKSVLVRHDHGPVVRYRMLEVLREYGRDRLREAGEERRLRGRHLAWYQRLAGEAGAQWCGPRQPESHAQLADEVENLRAAVESALAEPAVPGSGALTGPERALAVVTAVPLAFWQVRGLLPECRSRLEPALARATAPTPLRARALVLAAHLAFDLGDAEAARRLRGQGEELALRLGAVDALAYAAHVGGLLEPARGPGAARRFQETQERALEILSGAAGPEPALRVHLLNAAGLAAAVAGDRARAASCRDDVDALTGAGELCHRARSRMACALAAWSHVDLEAATREASESLRLVLRQGTVAGSWDRSVLRAGLEVLAWIAARRRRFRRAATLLGAAGALGAGAPESVTGLRHLTGYHDRCGRLARDALGDAGYETAHRRGRGLGHEAAIALALEEREPGTAAPPAGETAGGSPPTPPPTPLTPREQQVAELVAAGQSNREIAATLVVSQRTAEGHVENILTKLDLSSRAQIAVWATRRRRARTGGR
jgi:predicted ATPase/DNA-binding CsgD family transcriptional regulator